MGKYFSAILCVLVLLFAVSTVNASITGWNCADDGDGAIVMSPATWTDNGSHNYDLSMSGAQYWGPGHVAGEFTTDTDLDPTVRIIEDISNDTTFDWADYHITIGMTHMFTFVNAGLLMPDGWTVTIGAVTNGTIPNGGGDGYVGTIDYVKGPTGDVVAMGDDGTFDLKISFSGSTSFCLQQVPTPEPATIILLGLGAVAAIRRKRA